MDALITNYEVHSDCSWQMEFNFITLMENISRKYMPIWFTWFYVPSGTVNRLWTWKMLSKFCLIELYFALFRFPRRSCDDIHWFCIFDDIFKKIWIQFIRFQYACCCVGNTMGIFSQRLLSNWKWTHKVCPLLRTTNIIRSAWY